jgi:hypothetical protein
MFCLALDLAIVGWTFKDARRRIEDPVIVAVCVASAALFPLLGALIYVRTPRLVRRPGLSHPGRRAVPPRTLDGMSRYPRTCRGEHGPHAINGPEDEKPNGDCRACHRETNRRWRRASPEARERERERVRRWRDANPAKSRESSQRWREGNPDKVRAKHENYTATGRRVDVQARWRRARDEARDEQLAAELGIGPVGKLRSLDALSGRLRPSGPSAG